MARFGTNMKLTVSEELRDATRAVYGDVLGGKLQTPIPPMDLFVFDDRFHLGVFFVDAADALAPADAKKGAWIELKVDDNDTVTKALAKLGIEPFDYEDKTHAYFQAPGGQVFRLARA